jgi:hypothetical protein
MNRRKFLQIISLLPVTAFANKLTISSSNQKNNKNKEFKMSKIKGWIINLEDEELLDDIDTGVIHHQEVWSEVPEYNLFEKVYSKLFGN